MAGNWKMFKTRAEARETVLELRSLLGDVSGVEVVVCPPFTSLAEVAAALEGSSIRLGAQNVHWEDEGAFTGEISTRMLLDCGCRFVIVGHSERRQSFGESDEMVGRKLRKALSTPLIPILCVGESLEERESDRVEKVVLGQLERALAGWTAPDVSRVIIAYEPVWAIGTGQTATPEIAEQVHRLIRDWLGRRFEDSLAGQMRILYGGSVKPENIGALMAQEDIDGALVGGASLDASTFARIVTCST